MLNTRKIKARMVEQGKTIQEIAPKIKCSPYILGKKISNKTPIKLNEVMQLCDELNITKEEFSEFFLN